MKESELERIDKFISSYRVTRGKGFRLRDIDPGDTAHLKSEDKDEAKEMLARGVDWLKEEQDKAKAGGAAPAGPARSAMTARRCTPRARTPCS